jgi:hypothetical protein
MNEHGGHSHPPRGAGHDLRPHRPSAAGASAVASACWLTSLTGTTMLTQSSGGPSLMTTCLALHAGKGYQLPALRGEYDIRKASGSGRRWQR